MYRRHSSFIRPLAGLAIVAAVVVSACSPAPTAPPSPPATSGPPDASAPASPGPTMTVRAYFFLGGELGTAGLVPLLREVPETEGVAGAAMAALLAGPTAEEGAERAITSTVPAGSRLLGVTVEDGIATVDLSREFESGGGSASVLGRLGQIVFTLTQFPTVQSVVFRIEGSQASVFSSEGIVLNRPVGRPDFVDSLPAIFVDQPAYGGEPGNPARVGGTANVFEATFLITLLDGSGAPLIEVSTMATCGTGCWGTFDETLGYTVAEAGWGTLRVWAGSAKDGSPIYVREYPVWLSPAS